MITEETYKAMRCKSARPGRFYMLPKIHKLNHPGRPIALCIGTPTEKISAFVDYVLSPFMSQDWIPSYIKDTTDFLQQLQILNHIPDSAILVTMDVTSLYTNIPHNEGINSVANILKLSGHDKDFIDEIKSCIYFILKNNVFTFN